MTTKTGAAEAAIDRALAAATKDRIYEITTDQGKMRVSIPEDWKITYGPVSPGAKGSYSGGAMALRVYEAETKQRALFTGVYSFRDMSLPIMRAVVRQRGTSKWLPDNPTTVARVLRGIKHSDLERDWINEADLDMEANTDEEAF